MFTGGALENLSIFALGIMPYISASIIMQLLGMVCKPVEEMRKEGEAGRRKIEQYTRYGTIVLSHFQSFGIAIYLEGLNDADIGGGRFGDVVATPRLGLPSPDDDHADDRHRVHHVAGRADHRARASATASR